jgi:predicted outer membrane protein
MKKLPSQLAAASFLALALAASNALAQAPAVPSTPAAATTGVAGATTTTAAPAATPKPKPLGESEKRFFKEVSEAILIEQKLALMGTKNAQNEEAKKAAGTINNELTKLWEKFATLSQEKGATIATEVSKSDASKAERIGKQKEEKFDKDLIEALGKEAKKTTKLFESKTLQDPEVKQFAAEWAPTIKGQETTIDRAEKALGKRAK